MNCATRALQAMTRLAADWWILVYCLIPRLAGFIASYARTPATSCADREALFFRHAASIRIGNNRTHLQAVTTSGIEV